MGTSESALLIVGLTKSVVVTTISGMKNNLAQCCYHFLLNKLQTRLETDEKQPQTEGGVSLLFDARQKLCLRAKCCAGRCARRFLKHFENSAPLLS